MCIGIHLLMFICRERQSWRCNNCMVWGTAVWAVRDGPDGPRVSYHFTFCSETCLTLLLPDTLPQLWPAVRARQDCTGVVQGSSSPRHPRRSIWLIRPRHLFSLHYAICTILLNIHDLLYAIYFCVVFTSFNPLFPLPFPSFCIVQGVWPYVSLRTPAVNKNQQIPRTPFSHFQSISFLSRA
jgi:hypothetical protein